MSQKLGKKALKGALKRLELKNEDDLMFAIGEARLSEREVMEALVPGSAIDLPDEGFWRAPQRMVRIRGLKKNTDFALADCCHPVPGDRIVGVLEDSLVCIHAIDCLELAKETDEDWIDLTWDPRTEGATGRLRVMLYNRLGTLAEMTRIFSINHANISHLALRSRDELFGTYTIDLEVRDLAHLTRIISALRASDAIAQAERV